MGRAIATVGLGLAALVACSGAPTPPAPVPAGPAHVQPPPPPLPAWTYWEPVSAPVTPTKSSVELPVDVTKLERTPGEDARWSAAPKALREAIAARGFAVLPSVHPSARIGDFYASLRDDRVAWVLTLDAMFAMTHLALDRAMADLDAMLFAPALATMLRRVDVRLEAESRGAGADMGTPYLVARGVVAVALAFVDDHYRPPAAVQPLVDGEKARVLTHEGVAVSPWLGVPLDYSAMSPRGAADRDEAHAGWFRAVAWLEGAALSLEGDGEPGVRAEVDVATARDHARAALLLARLLDYDVDPEAASAWDRVSRAGELLVGPADDPSPRDLAGAAEGLKLDLRSGDWFANVAAVDRVRHATARARLARIDDGSLGSIAPRGGLAPAMPIGRLAPGFRLVGPAATPDGELLQALVFPLVGKYTGGEPAATDRDGQRALPTALDVAAWLGSKVARDRLHAAKDDAYARYDEALRRLEAARPPQGALERHRTPYLSMIDAMETWLRPSLGDAVQPGAGTTEWAARKAEVALGAWTELRHDATAMARVQVVDLRIAPRTTVESPVPVFVEPNPEAIAKLDGVVRQLRQELVGAGLLPRTAPSLAVLDEVDDLLRTALGVAEHEASDEAVPQDLAQALAGLPSRLRALETTVASAGAADVALIADVHSDRPSARALEQAVGRVEELWTVERDPETHKLWLAVGASLPHFEIVTPMASRQSDAQWREKLTADGEPPPGALATAYTLKR
ncbi:MAG TPA: DUF3160 domain-containing protein [Polyangiaceae bacterium]